jgi:lysophospholipase L1-like esterase
MSWKKQIFGTDSSGNTVLVGPDGESLTYAGKVKRSAIMTRSMCGRFASMALSGNRTTSIEYVLAAPYDRVRIILPNLYTSAIPDVKVCVAPTNTQRGETQTAGGSAANSLLTPSGGVGTWIDAATIELAASDGTTPSFTATEWIDVSALARVDGGAGSILLVRIEIPVASAYLTQMYSGTFDKWGNTADVGARTYRATSQNVLGVTTKALCTGYGWDDFHQAAIVQYVSRVAGVTVCGFGDSITEGSGVDPYGYSWLHQSAEAVSRAACPVESANFGWGTKDSNEFYALAALIVPLIKPHIVFWSAFTPNLFSAASDINTMRAYAARLKQLAADYDTVPVMWTGIPSTYGLAQGKDWATLDATRVSYNTEILASGEVVCDFSSVMTGGFNATNAAQYDIISGATTDGLHPNTTGVQIMAGKAAETMNWLGIHS